MNDHAIPLTFVPPDKYRRRLLVATSAAGGLAIVAAAVPFIDSMEPSERAKAIGAPVTTDVSKVAPGEIMTIAWRGQPVWILHRTPEMLAGLSKIESELLDPDSKQPQQPAYCKNPYRSRNPKYLIAVAICTHLGCIPTFRPDVAPADLGPQWQGGFYCPCHGSRYDLAGRVYKAVPAPLNLLIPPHYYADETKVTIGLDTKAT